jgi:23S rRNA (guanine745-N1)-methyltransferase
MESEQGSLLVCPICGERLRPGPGVLSCARSHSFDVARAGYVNLLPARKKLAPTVGDSREMLAARRRFLDAGHFSPLAELIGDLVADTFAEWTGLEGAVVEIGSGTGYYIGSLRDRYDATGLYYFGFDISKEAVKLAARSDPRITFALADVKRRIPLVDGSALVLLDVFSPRNPDEFHRMLAPDGVSIVALPAADHLGELVDRFDLLTVPPDKPIDVARELGDRLEVVERVPLSHPLRLGPDEVVDLIAMGPSARHVDLSQIRESLEDEVLVTASFVVLAFRHR